MKILWISQSPFLPTGYGKVTQNICGGLGSLGHDVYVLGLEYRGMPLNLPGFKLLGAGAHEMSFDILPFYLEQVKPDVVIGLHDVWRTGGWLEACKKAGVPYINYMPIDGDQIHQSWMPIVKEATLNVCLSKYGVERLASVGIEAEYVYHGVDVDTFKRYPEEDIEKMKEMSGLGGKFIIGSVSRNANRKMVPRLIKAFAEFASDKEDVILLLHMEPNDRMGWELPDLLARYDVQAKVFFPGSVKHPYNRPSEQDLAKEVNMFDVHALSTAGEGFGMPIAETMACGIPNVLTNYTTSAELVGDTGYLADVQTMVVGQFNVDRALVDESHMATYFEKLYNDRDLLKKMSDDAEKRAMELFPWDMQVKKMEAICQSLVGMPDWIEIEE